MRRRLDDLLVDERLADDEMVAAARRRARRDNEALVLALLDDERLDERLLADVLARRLSLPRVDPATLFVEMDALREVTYDLAQARCLLPFALERQGSLRVLRVAMADPLDADAVEEIEASSGCRVEPSVGLASELGAAIEKAYRGIVTKLIPRRQRVPFKAPPAATEPHHRLDEDAPLDVRVRALVSLLVEKGLVTDEEWLEAVKRVLKQQ